MTALECYVKYTRYALLDYVIYSLHFVKSKQEDFGCEY